MTWREEAQELLLTNQYQELTQLCEQAINEGSEKTFPYWYLGLAYLLQGAVGEAQGVWLTGLFEVPITDDEEGDQRTQQLIDLLEAEAHRQEDTGNLETSLILREQLQELNPEVNSWLHLIQLKIQTGNWSEEDIETWQVITQFKQIAKETVDQEQLLETVQLILSAFHFPEMEELIEFGYQLAEDQSKFFRKVINVAVDYHYKNQLDVAIQLAEKCCLLSPKFSHGLEILSFLYTTAEFHKKAIETAQKFQETCTTLVEKVQGSGATLKALLSAGAWSEVFKIYENHQILLKELIATPPQEMPDEIHITLPFTVFTLAYLRDQARENRWLQNQVMQLYHNYLPNRDENLTYSPDCVDLRVNRPLRIGYIGHTLRKHSVGWLSRWLIQNHHRDQFQITLYLVHYTEDELTQSFMANVDQVHRVGYDERSIAQQIIDDQIDILVELDSLTVTTTCKTLCYRTAPIQVTWLGWDASGLPNIDYYIADPYVLPENAQEYYQQKIWRLPNSYVAVKGFEVAPPLLHRNDLDIPDDAIVYFSAQGAFKRHPETVRLQLQILKSVPNSYFLIKGTSDQELIEQFFSDLAKEVGIDLKRLRFLPRTPNEFIHRGNLEIADVVLDTYPYNGATTTLETLWMGVPLVTKVGQQYVARNSYTFLKNAGIEEGIAWTDKEYVEWGVKFGTDENLRRDVHWKLLQSRKTAPLWDIGQFINDMETAYQQMWKRYVSENSNNQIETLPLNLHIGGQEQHPGWKIVDVEPRPGVDYVTNASNLSMFESDSVDSIYSSNTLEHCYYGINNELVNTLKEWNRVLKPGGKLMISVPDLEVLSGLYIRKDLTFTQRFQVMRMMFGGQTNSYDVHKVGFTFETLKAYLQKANFRNVEKVKEFNLFNDCSSLKFLDTPISLNVIAYKNTINAI